MPTQTFLNLPEEKRMRIYNAICGELQSVPFPEMSINRIIKNAEIPRGSFYQYFDNKDDAFEFFVAESSMHIKNSVLERISTVHGDIFDLSESVFDEILKVASEQNLLDMVRHVIPYVNINKIEPLSEFIENMDSEKKMIALSSLGIGNLALKNEEEIMDVIGVIEALFQSALPKIFSGVENEDEIRSKFRRKLNLLKRVTAKEGI